MKDTSLNILTGATENYALSLACLLISAYESNPQVNITACLVNWTKTLSEAFQKQFPKTDFRMVYAEIKFHDEGKSGDVLRLKVEWIHEHYLKMPSPFLWIDADSLVFNKAEPLLEKLKSHHILLSYRKELTPYFKFNLSTLAFSKTKDPDLVMKFLDEFMKNAYESKNAVDWYHDQWAFYLTLQSFPLNVYALSEKENSLNGNPNTIVYSKKNPFSIMAKTHSETLSDLQAKMNMPQRYGKRFYTSAEVEMIE